MPSSGRASRFGTLLLRVGALLLVLIGTSGPATAGNNNGQNNDGKNNDGKNNGKDKDKTVKAPEIDLGALPGALMLLAGGTMVVTERFRRK